MGWKPAINAKMVNAEFTEDTRSLDDEDEYWLLGGNHLVAAGNHLVAAMKQLHPDRTVLCHIYEDLTRDECLRVAATHQKKSVALPLTFQN